MNEQDRIFIANEMSNESGALIDPELVVELPSDGAIHVNNVWRVFGARCGEYTAIAYWYSEPEDHITVYTI